MRLLVGVLMHCSPLKRRLPHHGCAHEINTTTHIKRNTPQKQQNQQVSKGNLPLYLTGKLTFRNNIAHMYLNNCRLHAPSNLATSVALCCVIKLHILEWPFIVASVRYTCAIIMLSNQHLDMPHR